MASSIRAEGTPRKRLRVPSHRPALNTDFREGRVEPLFRGCSVSPGPDAVIRRADAYIAGIHGFLTPAPMAQPPSVSSAPMAHRIAEVPVRRVAGMHQAPASDRLAVEEPLEIRLCYPEGGERVVRPVSVTMRTPGDDVALALGFLYAEGILGGYDDVDAVRHSGPAGGPRGTRNVVTVTLRPGVAVDGGRLERHFYTTSSCGVCGKTSLDALALAPCPPLPPATACLVPSVVHGLPEALADAQAVFEQTGGLHAAALFGLDGHLQAVREDVGRHNALDKLVGGVLMERGLPASGCVVLVSGRVSFELVQKALRAGVPVLAAVGAPSSLAVALAEAHGQTLLGFVRDGRFNVYAGAGRLAPEGTG